MLKGVNTLPAATTVSTVTLRVARLEPALKFYREVIGLALRSQASGQAVLGSMDEDILVLLERPQAKHEAGTTGLYHLAVLLPSRPHLAQWLRHASALSVRLGAGDHDVSEAFYLSDSEGNGVEVYADRPRSVWKKEGDGIYITTQAVDTEDLLKEVPAQAWQGVPAGTTLGHVHLRVNSLDEAKAFYVYLLGFALMSDYTGMGALFVAAGGYHHHIGLNVWQTQDAPAPSEGALGLVHYTVSLPSAGDVEEISARLSQAHYPFSTRENGLELKDPAGNGLRFTAPKA